MLCQMMDNNIPIEPITDSEILKWAKKKCPTQYTLHAKRFIILLPPTGVVIRIQCQNDV